MKHEFRLADIGEGLEEAEIIEWLVKVGDEVDRDQPLIEVMTDKSNAELPAPTAGTVVQLGGDIGDILNVGALIAVIDDSSVQDSSIEGGSGDAGGVDDGSGDDGGVDDGSGDDDSGDDGASRVDTTEAPSGASPVHTEDAAPDATKGEHTTEVLASSSVGDTPPPAIAGRRVKASPSTRRLAAERGIDLMTVAGTGPGGRILMQDLDAPRPYEAPVSPSGDLVPERTQANDELATAPPAPAVRQPEPASVSPETVSPETVSPETVSPETVSPETVAPTQRAARSQVAESAPPSTVESAPQLGTVPLRGMRRAIAHNMARSWFDIPHIHAFEHIDAEPMLDIRARLRATDNPHYAGMTPLPFFVAAVVSALRAHPAANASINMAEETVTYHSSVNVGVAVAAPQGLVVPVLKQAEGFSFDELCAALSTMIQGARAGSLSPNDFKDGTVTVTNFGSLGGEQAAPLIRPPEAMIIGFGSVADRPFVVDDEVVARKTMHLVAGADHRLIDGDVVTGVLCHIADSLSDPLRLVL